MTWLYSLAQFSQLLGLSIMLGGMLALGAFTAPVIFHQFARPEAGAAMAIIFRRFDTVLLVALLLVVVGEFFRVSFSGGFSSVLQAGWLSGFRMGALLLLTVLILVSVQAINPKLYAMQQTRQQDGTYIPRPVEQQKNFDKLHQLSEKLYKMELLLATMVLALQPFLGRLPK